MDRGDDGDLVAAPQILPHEIRTKRILKADGRGFHIHPLILQQMQGDRAHVGDPHPRAPFPYKPPA